MNPFQDSIEALYLACADVPKPPEIDGCPCCIGNKEIGVLLATPLRVIQAEQLSAYASSAFLTVGDVPDYLYFLPRILELSMASDWFWPDPEVIGRAIASTRPVSWPEPRRQALDALLKAHMCSLLAEDGSAGEIDSWLCAIGRMGLDVRPYLAQIVESPAHVLGYYEQNARRLPERLDNEFWELPNPGHDAIVQWFGTEKVSDIVLAAYGVVLYYAVSDSSSTA